MSTEERWMEKMNDSIRINNKYKKDRAAPQYRENKTNVAHHNQQCIIYVYALISHTEIGEVQ